MIDSELAYLAGYFDADGYCGLTTVHQNGRLYFYPQIEVGGIRREPLELFQRRFGGNLNRKTNKGRPQEQTMLKWNLSNRRCYPVLEALVPYLKVKRKQAQLLLRYARECCRSHGTWPRLTDSERARRDTYKRLLARMKLGDIDR